MAEICIVEGMGDEASRTLQRNYTWAVVLAALAWLKPVDMTALHSAHAGITTDMLASLGALGVAVVIA